MSDDVDNPDIEPEDPTQEVETDGDEPDDDKEQFDAERAREKLRRINSENRNLRERAKKAEEAAKDGAEKGERLTALEAENLRLRVAVKHGLPENLAKRLSGGTEEEMLADAEELLELLGGKKPPTNQPRERLRGGGDPTAAADETADLDKFAEAIFRK
jgi:hypothetical protein